MPRLERAALVLAAFLAVLVVVGWVGRSAPEKRVSPLIERAVEMGYFPCEREDSAGPCYWDASVRGNGQGRSFVVTGDNEAFYE